MPETPRASTCNIWNFSKMSSTFILCSLFGNELTFENFYMSETPRADPYATQDMGSWNAATHCNTLQCTTTDWNILEHTAIHCNTLQRTATRCNTLQHTATHCNTLQHTVTHCNILQHTATHCSTLQHTVTHCNTHGNTLQHKNLPETPQADPYAPQERVP